MDTEEAWKIDSDEAWERFKAGSVFKSSSSEKLDTMAAALNELQTTVSRLAGTIPGAQADMAAIQTANASAQPPMGMGMGMEGAPMDVSQVSGEDDFVSEDDDMADEFDDSNVPIDNTPREDESAQDVPAVDEAPEEMPEELPEEIPEEAVAEEMTEELPEAPITDEAGLGGATDIGTATEQLMGALDNQILEAVQSGDREAVMKLMDQKDQIRAILESPISANPAEPPAEAEPVPEDVVAEDEYDEDEADEAISRQIDALIAAKKSDDAAVDVTVGNGAQAASDAMPAGDETTAVAMSANAASEAPESEVSTSADGKTLESIEDMVRSRTGGDSNVQKGCSGDVNMAASDSTTPVEASESNVEEAGSPVDAANSGTVGESKELIDKPSEDAKGQATLPDDESAKATSEHLPAKEDSSEGQQKTQTIGKSFDRMCKDWTEYKSGVTKSNAEMQGVEYAEAADFTSKGKQDPTEIASAGCPKENTENVAAVTVDDEEGKETSEPIAAKPAGDEGTQSTVKSDEAMADQSDAKAETDSDGDTEGSLKSEGAMTSSSAGAVNPAYGEDDTTTPTNTGKVMKSFRELLSEFKGNSEPTAACTPAGNIIEAADPVRKSMKELPHIRDMVKLQRGGY